MRTPDPQAAAAEAARDAYGRLVAWLARRTGDLAGAEDALADAFESALQSWPRDGVPDRPEAWLFQAARRRGIDAHRRRLVRDQAEATLELMMVDREEAPSEDHRLGLMGLCAHEAIDPGIRAPLMMQTILGLNAEQIGRAFGVAAATMGQRLGRAKRKIKEAKIPFEPELDRARLAVVCEAIYGAFGIASEAGLRDATQDALVLGRLAHRASGEDPETGGLLALMLHVDARRDARRLGGRYVPLDEQDTGRWRRDRIVEAESVLMAAARHRRPGRFQLEAAIQSAHAQRALSGRTDWDAITDLYERLLAHNDSAGARLGWIASLAESRSPSTALQALNAEPSEVTDTQPGWALRAHLAEALGQDPRPAAEKAIALSPDPAVQAHLSTRYFATR
ncbi:MAG: DUF6596 domain-containing protein [Myxococcota bacterium]